ncbi:MAG: hypothetical protein LBF22_02765 [Deltaproteobacteria bacterium]|jgi:hypothetical protein|nr:hypothetical protein [Deltaproteobacteria bacterium]
MAFVLIEFKPLVFSIRNLADDPLISPVAISPAALKGFHADITIVRKSNELMASLHKSSKNFVR